MLDAPAVTVDGRDAAAQFNTSTIRRWIRKQLPAEAFQPRPAGVLVALALVTAIVAASCILVAVRLPAPAAILLSAACGCAYASLFFLGHDIGHGAVVRSRRLQVPLMWASYAIFLLSPTLWRVWHNKIHHGHTNCETHDPDNFGFLDSYRQSGVVRLVAAMTPGSGHWSCALYLPLWFTAHTQIVLWRQSRRCRGFESLDRRRAAAESGLMALCWCCLGLKIGAWGSLLVIVLPMLVANAVTMSYIVTNHLLMPLVDEDDQLATSMSVTTHPLLDLIHFNFSHHAEHHLFPAMSSKYFPLVRAALKRYAGARYLAPPHWKALQTVFGTPRLHLRKDLLLDPPSGRVAAVPDIRAALRTGKPSEMPFQS